MRNLNECQAEVFRRSENRIKAQKQRRNHVVMTCLPLVLCVSILSVFMLTGGKEKTAESNGTSDMPLQGGVVSGTAVQVEVSDQKETRTYTDTKTVTTVYNQISNYHHNENITTETAGGVETETQDELTPGVTGTITSGQRYQIVITFQDGSKLSYDLQGRVLTQKPTNRTYTLTEEQHQKLTELLDIA